MANKRRCLSGLNDAFMVQIFVSEKMYRTYERGSDLDCRSEKKEAAQKMSDLLLRVRQRETGREFSLSRKSSLLHYSKLAYQLLVILNKLQVVLTRWQGAEIQAHGSASIN